MNVKELYEYGVRLTVFENGDVFISTPGDIYILKLKQLYMGYDTTIAKGLESVIKGQRETIELLEANIKSIRGGESHES